jgi:hypothetical protein
MIHMPGKFQRVLKRLMPRRLREKVSQQINGAACRVLGLRDATAHSLKGNICLSVLRRPG